MSAQKVVLCYPVGEKDTDKIAAEFTDCEVIVASQDSIATDIHYADIFCGHAKVPVDWPAVVHAGRLKWIQSSAAGLDHCLTPDVIKSDILVSGCSALFANQVAEQTLAMLLAMLRRIPVFINAACEREFVRRPTDTLHGKHVGILGFGGNGRRIAELLADIASGISATDLFPDFEIPSYVNCYAPEYTQQVVAQSDIVIVTLSLNDETDKFVGREHFQAMKQGAYFVNVARGRVVDQQALVESLTSGKLTYAAVDVVDPEPLPANDPLWEISNVLITPHVGAQAENRVPLTTELFCQNYRRYLAGQTLINEVDKSLEMPLPQHRLRVSPAGTIVVPKLM